MLLTQQESELGKWAEKLRLRRNGKLLNGQLITSITIKPRQKNLMSAINGSIHGYESAKKLTIGNPFRITGVASHKGKTPTNEVERLRQEVRQLKAKAEEREVQIAFTKKLVEIHNREVERPDDIKRFRK